VIFLPGKPHPLPPERTLASSTVAAGRQTSALASGLELSELSKSSYAAKAAAASRIRQAAGPKVAAAVKAKHRRSQKLQSAPLYLNPLRAVTGLQPQRIDMGVDFAGSGPIYPIGDGVITSAMSNSSGWPGGGWITYQLTDGPAAGLVVYVAEDVQPTVSVGAKVTPTTEIANMFNGSEGIETGWAMPDSSSAESQLPVAGGISGAGPFPTAVGVNFDALLQALGVPAASNAGQSPFGLLPANYPVSWSGLG
jgi:murein DD-endopeptidase MepM/ murein hydrolase activator NlpD